MTLQELFDANRPANPSKPDLAWVVRFKSLCQEHFPGSGLDDPAMLANAMLSKSPPVGSNRPGMLVVYYLPNSGRLDVSVEKSTDKTLTFVFTSGLIEEYGIHNGLNYCKHYTPYVDIDGEWVWKLTYSTAPRTIANATRAFIPLYCRQALDELERLALDWDTRTGITSMEVVKARVRYIFTFLTRIGKPQLFDQLVFDEAGLGYMRENWSYLLENIRKLCHPGAEDHDKVLREWLLRMDGPTPRTGNSSIIVHWNRAREKHLFGPKDTTVISYRAFYRKPDNDGIDPMGLLNNAL